MRLQLVEEGGQVVYQFGLQDIEKLLASLREHHLTCSLSLPAVGEVWEMVEQQLAAHLSSHTIVARSSRDPFTRGYFATPLLLIHPKKNGRQVVQRPFVESDLAGSTFTVSALKKISSMVSNPEDSELPLLFFGKSHLFQ